MEGVSRSCLASFDMQSDNRRRVNNKINKNHATEMKRDKAAHSAQTHCAHSDRSSGDSPRRVHCTTQGELRAQHCRQKLFATTRTVSLRTLRAADRQRMLATLL